MEKKATLYHYWRSSCSWRIRWALEIQQIAYNPIPVDIVKNEQRRPEYLKINRAGLLPTLLIHGLVLTESMAILEYLNEKSPIGKRLLPSSPADRAMVRSLAYHIAGNIFPFQTPATQKAVQQLGGHGGDFAQKSIDKGFKTLESMLRKTAGTYCLGSEISIADLCLIPQVYNAIRYNVCMRPFPVIQRIYDHCLKQPSCIASHPDQFKPT